LIDKQQPAERDANVRWTLVGEKLHDVGTGLPNRDSECAVVDRIRDARERAG
jgi:hypothetical protein